MQVVWNAKYVDANVRFGSLAVIRHHISRTAAFGGKADVQPANFQGNNLNVSLSLKRSFRLAQLGDFECPLTAKSGHQTCKLQIR